MLWAFVGMTAAGQIALLALAMLLFDLFGHDLLCRFARARWDPDERACFRPQTPPTRIP